MNIPFPQGNIVVAESGCGPDFLKQEQGSWSVNEKMDRAAGTI